MLKTSRSGPAVLTEAGAAVLPYCQQLLEVACEACKAMQDFRLASTGVVSLGASQTVGTYLMPRLIAAFKKNNPEVGSASLTQDAVDLGPSLPPPFPDFVEPRDVLVGCECSLLFLVMEAGCIVRPQADAWLVYAQNASANWIKASSIPHNDRKHKQKLW